VQLAPMGIMEARILTSSWPFPQKSNTAPNLRIEVLKHESHKVANAEWRMYGYTTVFAQDMKVRCWMMH
jgi:hypothetical protein